MKRHLRAAEAVVLAILLCGMVRPVWGGSVTSDDLSEAARWVAAKFQNKVDVRPVASALKHAEPTPWKG